jgi:hypothetical protein
LQQRAVNQANRFQGLSRAQELVGAL